MLVCASDTCPKSNTTHKAQILIAVLQFKAALINIIHFSNIARHYATAAGDEKTKSAVSEEKKIQAHPTAKQISAGALQQERRGTVRYRPEFDAI